MISSLQLAKICGVSQGTVDRAIHGRGGVHPSTRERIVETARKLGYRPNPAARELLGRASMTVGAIVPSLNGVFFMDLMNTIREALAKDNFRLFITPVTRTEEFLEALEEFAARRMRAAIVIPPEELLRIPDRITRDMPVVSLLSPCRGENVTFLAPDEIQTGRQAVDYLASRGHTRILHITHARKAKAIFDRAKGFRDRMGELGLPFHVRTTRTLDSLYQDLELFKPTAIFCHNDWLALNVLRMIQPSRSYMPLTVAVLGVDNSPTFCSIYPDLTTMEYPAAEIAGFIRQWLSDGRTSFKFEPFRIVERATVWSRGQS